MRDGDGRDIWTVDLARGLLSRFTSTPAAEQNVVWSPDQLSLAFGVGGEGIFQQRVDRAKPPQLLLAQKGLGAANPTTSIPR